MSETPKKSGAELILAAVVKIGNEPAGLNPEADEALGEDLALQCRARMEEDFGDKTGEVVGQMLKAICSKFPWIDGRGPVGSFILSQLDDNPYLVADAISQQNLPKTWIIFLLPELDNAIFFAEEELFNHRFKQEDGPIHKVVGEIEFALSRSKAGRRIIDAVNSEFGTPLIFARAEPGTVVTEMPEDPKVMSRVLAVLHGGPEGPEHIRQALQIPEHRDREVAGLLASVGNVDAGGIPETVADRPASGCHCHGCPMAREIPVPCAVEDCANTDCQRHQPAAGMYDPSLGLDHAYAGDLPCYEGVDVARGATVRIVFVQDDESAATPPEGDDTPTDETAPDA